MPTYIIKPSRDEDFYVWWSTVVDAPIGWGPRDYVPLGSEGRPERFARADERGTSANWDDWPVEEMPFGWNVSEWRITNQDDLEETGEGWWLLPRKNLREFCRRRDAGEEIADLVKWEADETDKGTLTLGEVMDALRSLPEGSLVTINGKKPTSINSYRGYYEHLAIATDERQGGEQSEVIEPYRGQYSYSNADAAEVLIGSCGVVGDLLNALALCIGATFQGYKGGDFTMGYDTLMFAAEWGACGQRIVGVSVEDDTVALTVAVDE